MNPSLRLFLCGVYVQTLLTALMCVNPGGLGEAPSLFSQWFEARRRNQALKAELHAGQLCQSIKHQVIRDLLDGHLSPSEAVRRFEEANAQQGDSWWALFRKHYAGNSDRERHYREVIAYVGFMAPDQMSGRAEEVVALLEAELRQCIRPEPNQPDLLTNGPDPTMGE